MPSPIYSRHASGVGWFLRRTAKISALRLRASNIPARDMRLGDSDASAGKNRAKPIDHVLLFCYSPTPPPPRNSTAASILKIIRWGRDPEILCIVGEFCFPRRRVKKLWAGPPEFGDRADFQWPGERGELTKAVQSQWPWYPEQASKLAPASGTPG